MCPQFKWEMSECRFTAAVRILKLGGYDMVLGVDWMRRLGPITFNSVHQKVQLKKDGQQVTLQGLRTGVTLKMITGKQAPKMLQNGKDLIFGCLCTISAAEVIQESKIAPKLQELIS